jgi:hypothetical protein
MKTILSVVIFFSLAACASVDEHDSTPRVKDDNDYVTGSHLPRRKGSAPSEAQTLSTQQVEDLQRVRPGPMPTGAGR